MNLILIRSSIGESDQSSIVFMKDVHSVSCIELGCLGNGFKNGSFLFYW